jgi:6-phosphogluconolactonase
MSLVARYPNAKLASEACGIRCMDLLRKAIDKGERASLAVSGGSSPQPMFELFGKSDFPWHQAHVFWVDERCVPPNDAQSNFRLANEAWLRPAQVPPANVHRILGELDPEEAARRYAEDLSSFFGSVEMPRFTVIHRGMGSDAHTASLFPGSPLIEDKERIAAAAYVEKMEQWRVTLLPGVLQAARYTVILAAGPDKAQALDAVLTGPYDPKRLPAQIGARNSKTSTWFVDEAAATLLPPGIE